MARFSWRHSFPDSFFMQLIFPLLVTLGSLFAFESAIAQSLTNNTQAIESRSYSQKLDRVRVLIRANVLNLAQSILETQGPPAIANDQWLGWERQLWALYETRGEWRKLHQRALQIPPSFPEKLRYEASEKAITALIALGESARARTLARQYLFSPTLSELEKKTLRKKIIESYLDDNLLKDATISMRHYQHDYRSQEEDWLLLSARVYMQTGQVDEAIGLLAPLTQPSAQLMRIYARLQNGSLPAQQAVMRVNGLLQSNEAPVNELDALAVMISAARKTGSMILVVEYLERYLLAKLLKSAKETNTYGLYGPEDLFEAYAQIANDEALRVGLLQGDEPQWLGYAERASVDNNIIRKALFGYVGQKASNAGIRRRATNGYVNTLIGAGNADLVLVLFGKNTIMGPLNLSADVGLYLSNLALEKGNVRLAAAVGNSLTEVPAGMKPEEWILHVSRVSIIAGQYSQGAERLRQWILDHPTLRPDQTDQVLQPVFDLQTVKQHELALTLLLLINQRSPSQKHQREIAYWIAESYRESKQYLRAADYFLFSALKKANGYDQWGESARFQAADALMQANQVNDAKVLFEDLLSRATEESRKTALNQKLQQLALLESYQSIQEDGQ